MRFSTRIVIFLLFLNAGAGLMVQSGVAADWGVDPNPGGDAELEKANATAAEIDPSGGLGDTLFGLYNSIAGTFQTVLETATAGPTMLNNLGVPGYLTAFLFAPLYLIVGIDVVYLLTQRRA
jgi:hypothetical protein